MHQNDASPSSQASQARLMHNKRRKRRVTLINKAHELATMCDAHVYVLVRYGGRYYSYKSLDAQSWPPPPHEISMSYPLPVELTYNDIAPNTSPKKSKSVPSESVETPAIARAAGPPGGGQTNPRPVAAGERQSTAFEYSYFNDSLPTSEHDGICFEMDVPCVFIPE